MSNTSLEIIHEGWLTKSPPSKAIWRARWRRRWFVLRHSGELPDQYFLEYYTDHNCRKLKGKIDLDQCEQVDAGLRFENRKQKYQHMFDVKTPKRVYYLAAESEEDMNKWVEYVCHVCGLMAYKDEDDYGYAPPAEDEETPTTESLTSEQQDPMLGLVTESPPVSPTSTISGPYIPISECISGKSLSSPNGLEDFNNILRQGGYGITATTQYGLTNNREGQSTCQKHALYSENKIQDSTKLICVGETGASFQVKTPILPIKRSPRPYDGTSSADNAEFYDSPRKLHPPNLELRQISETPPLHSPTTDGESVFTDEEWSVPSHHPPCVNWETFPDGDSVRQTRPSDSSAEVDVGGGGDVGSWSVVKRFGKLRVVDNVSSIPHDGSIGVHGRQLSLPINLQHQPVAPPRPPKPFHLLLEAPSHSYLNLENVSPQPRHNRNVRKPSVASLSSDTSKRTGIPGSPNDCVSASDGNEEPPSPLSPSQCSETVGVNDEMYDFPRSHQYANNPSSPSAGDGAEGKIHTSVRHCYTNAAPSKVNGEVFRYDFHHSDSPPSASQEGATTLEEPTSPHSDGSSSLASSSTAAVYSNLPSPLTAQGGSDVGHSGIPTPPAVNRGLKPGRKLSDSTSVVSNEPSPVSPATHLISGHFPPSVDRKLKPQLKQPEQELLPLAAPPGGRSGSETCRSLRKPRAAPSPTPPSLTPTALRNGQRQRSEHNSSSDDDHRKSPDGEPIYYFQQDTNKFIPATRFQELQYLDLDLEWDAASGTSSATQIPKSPERAQQPTSTVYKTVDFVKTEAFNRTRQEVEEVRKQCTAAEL